MSRNVLGGWVNGGFAKLDLPRLMVTRMLLQAESGGGKSWALRKILEITSGQVQQIIIDPEGEFASLREKHDLVIVAATGGDALAHPKTAALLATRLLETGVSAVIDIYDLKKRDRELFVQIFVDTMMNAPKNLWHPVLVAIDEAQMFCDENENALSTQAVIDLATRGRKRGFSLVAATQRIADFSKSAAAQLKNKLIGGTTLDVDVKRAAFELGKTPKDALSMLRALNPGEFYAFGPALTKGIEIVAIGSVETTHPKIGVRQALTAPKPTAAILAILPKLADLPKEAEQEARTVADLQRELAGVKRELTQAKKPQPPAPVIAAPKDVNGLEKARAAAVANAAMAKALRTILGEFMKFIIRIEAEGFKSAEATATIKEALDQAVGSAMQKIEAATDRRTRAVTELREQAAALMAKAEKIVSGEIVEIEVQVTRNQPFTVAPQTTIRDLAGAAHDAGKQVRVRLAPKEANGESKLTGAAQKILGVLSQFPEGCEAGKITLLSGYRYTGTFRNALSELRTAGFISGDNGSVMTITDDGLSQGPFPSLPTGDALVQYWLNQENFSGAAKKILAELQHGDELTKEELCQRTNYEYTGTFRNALSELRTAGVIVGKNAESMRISREIVP